MISQTDGDVAFGWPATYFEARFHGTAFRIRFSAQTDHFRLLVDGVQIALFQAPGTVDTDITGLSKDDHVIRLEKLTESMQGGSEFYGFYALKGSTPLQPLMRSHQIEFIGDSYTVGYGDTSPVRSCSENDVHNRTNSQLAFGPLVARHFNADYRIIAYSGFGMVRNYDGSSRNLNLPAIYSRLKPDLMRHSPAPPANWHPQWIVINLGTNDFSTSLKPDEKWADPSALEQDYRKRYIAFVHMLAEEQPKAKFILMGSDPFYDDVEAVSRSLSKTYPDRIGKVRFSNLALSACNSHPSLADHALLAHALERKIRELDSVWKE